MQTYFVSWKGVRSGPFTAEQICEMYGDGRISSLHSVLRGGVLVDVETLCARMRPEVPPPAALRPAPVPSMPSTPPSFLPPPPVPIGQGSNSRVEQTIHASMPPTADSHSYDRPLRDVVYSHKKRAIYVLLGATIGFLGVHNFYAGHFVRGGFQLLLLIVSVAFIIDCVLKWDFYAGRVYFMLGFSLVPLMAQSIWVIADLFVVTKDAEGDPMG